jgi:cell division septum initiation protein DivIVA
MTCFEKYDAYDESSMTKSTMTKTIEQYQQDCLWYQNEIFKLRKELETETDVSKIQRDILDKTLFELPVGNVTSHSYENIPERVKYYVRENALLESNQDEANELISQSMPNFFDHPSAGYILDNTALLIGIADKAKIEAWADREDLESLEKAIKTHYEYYSGLAANKHLSAIQMLDVLFKNNLGSGETQVLRAELEALKVKSRLFKSTQDGQEYLRCLHQEGDKHQSVGLWILDCLSYKESLEEIIKRPRKSETCRLIAQKALGLLSDDEYQPELLIEENLKLKMKIEDLEAVINKAVINKAFHGKVNSLMQCDDCGEYWDYHHEEHCKANL